MLSPFKTYETLPEAVTAPLIVIADESSENYSSSFFSLLFPGPNATLVAPEVKYMYDTAVGRINTGMLVVSARVSVGT